MNKCSFSTDSIYVLVVFLFIFVGVGTSQGVELTTKPGVTKQSRVKPKQLKPAEVIAPVNQRPEQPVRQPELRRKKDLLPDYTITSVSVRPQTVGAGGKVKITVIVANTTKTGPHDVLVRCLHGTKNLGEKRTSIQGGQQQRLEMIVSVDGSGQQDLEIIVDPDKRIQESDERNNAKEGHVVVKRPQQIGGVKHAQVMASQQGREAKVAKTVQMGMGAQHAADLIPVSLKSLKPTVVVGETVVMKAVIRNAGGKALRDVPVALYGNDKKLQSQKVSFAANAVQTVIFKIVLDHTGVYELHLRVDPNNAIVERNELNNGLRMSLKAIPGSVPVKGAGRDLQKMAKVAPIPTALSISPIPGGQQVYPTAAIIGKSDLCLDTISWSSMPKVGDNIGQSAIANLSVTNKGTTKSSASILEITTDEVPDGTPASDKDSFKMTSDIPELMPGQSYNIAWPSMFGGTWRLGAYSMQTFIHFDPAGEIDEMNNIRSLVFAAKPEISVIKKTDGLTMVDQDLTHTLSILKADLIANLSPINGFLTVGNKYTFTGYVKNIGSKVSDPCEVHVHFVNEDGTSGIYFAGADVPSLQPGWGKSITVTANVHYADFDYRKIRIHVDPDHVVDEEDETNNDSSQPVTVVEKPNAGAQLIPAGTLPGTLAQQSAYPDIGLDSSVPVITKPDLVVTLKALDGPLYYGTKHTFEATITNVGTKSAPASWMLLVAQNDDGMSFRPLEQMNIPVLPPGWGVSKTMTGEVAFEYSDKGYMFAAWADIRKDVDEVSESNNFSKKLPIALPAYPPNQP